MIAGANERKVAYKEPITGLGVVKVVAVNPTNEEYKQITGSEIPYDLVYEHSENQYQNNNKEFPIRILVHQPDFDIYEFINFSVGNNDDIAKTLSVRFIDSKGNMTYSKSLETIKENPRMSWFDADNARPCKIGEYNLYNFIQKIVSYDSRSENAKFLKDMTDNKITSEDLFNKNLSGLKNLVNWINENNFGVVVLFTVEEKEKDGKTYNVQRIVNKPDLFFYADNKDGSLSVANYGYKALEKFFKDENSSKIKGYFTYKLQKFNKVDCVNTEPEATIQEPSSNVTASWK